MRGENKTQKDNNTHLISKRFNNIKRNWYKFSRNPLSVIGLITVIIVILIAIFAPYFSPYPESAGKYVNFLEDSQPPSLSHLLGTDTFGRDILSRIFYGSRISLLMAAMVLLLVVPVGVILGLLAGYHQGSWIDSLIMRITDIFLALPPLVLALAICSILPPNLFNAMMAVCLMWWPWYTRLTYGIVSSLRVEFFVQAAEISGAGTLHILFREILPNCISTILTKMTLDVGFVILIASSLSFVGLGTQPPTPDLGSMVADGAKYLPEQWWITVFPGIAIILIVLAFNLLGDGIRDMFEEGA